MVSRKLTVLMIAFLGFCLGLAAPPSLVLAQSTADTALTRMGTAAVIAWAEHENLPYGNIVLTERSNDGFFAVLGANVDTRAGRTESWQETGLLVECRKISSLWRCSVAAVLNYSAYGVVNQYYEDSSEYHLVGVLPDGSVEKIGSDEVSEVLVSPMGDSLAILRIVGRRQEKWPDEYEVAVVDLAGEEIAVLSQPGLRPTDLYGWSSDGATLVVGGAPGGSTSPTEIWTWEVGSVSAVRLLETHYIWDARVSLVGDMIAAVTESSDDWSRGSSLVTVDIDSGEVITISNGDSGYSVQWSPTSELLIYTESDGNGREQVLLHNTKTGKGSVLCEGKNACFVPLFADRGESVLLYRTIYPFKDIDLGARAQPVKLDLTGKVIEVLGYSLPLDVVESLRLSRPLAISSGGTETYIVSYDSSTRNDVTETKLRLSDGHEFDVTEKAIPGRLSLDSVGPLAPPLDFNDGRLAACQASTTLKVRAGFIVNDVYSSRSYDSDAFGVDGTCEKYGLWGRVLAFHQADNSIVVAYYGSRTEAGEWEYEGYVTLRADTLEEIGRFPFDFESYDDPDNLNDWAKVLDVSSDGATLVFATGDSADLDMFVASSAGVQHVGGVVLSGVARLSPDGTTVAYLAEYVNPENGDYGQTLELLNLANGHTSSYSNIVVSPLSDYDQSYLEWTADGSGLVGWFVDSAAGEHEAYNLSVLDIESRTLQGLSLPSGGAYVGASVTPDLSKLAILTFDDYGSTTNHANVRVMDLQTEEVLFFAEVTIADAADAISPDLSKLPFEYLWLTLDSWTYNDRYVALYVNNQGGSEAEANYIIDTERGRMWRLPYMTGGIRLSPQVEEFVLPSAWLVEEIVLPE